MKITRLQTLCLSRPHEPERQWITAKYRTVKADCAIVIIDTDEGIQGIGEACAYGGPPQIREHVARLSEDLVGLDPTLPETAPQPTGERSADTAVAGIDAALFDIRGKATGVPVSELISAAPLKRIRLYASSGCRYDWEDRPEQVVDEAIGYADQGFTALKIRIGTDWSRSGVTVERFLPLLRKVTDAVGDRMDLMLDGNQRLTDEEALTIARALDEMKWTWFEEPIPQADVSGYAHLNAIVGIPITGGEQFTTLAMYEPYLRRHAYAIVQADAGCCGITEGLRIGRAAHKLGAGMCPHNWHNGLMTMANAHLVAALPDPKVLELCMIQGPLQWDILRDPPVIEDGHLVLPDAPGLGVNLSDDLEERFPYIEGHYAVPLDG
jgi:L-alanine-DL-glutamate epimerase-like enolase superfamily enzyme